MAVLIVVVAAVVVDEMWRLTTFGRHARKLEPDQFAVSDMCGDTHDKELANSLH